MHKKFGETPFVTAEQYSNFPKVIPEGIWHSWGEKLGLDEEVFYDMCLKASGYYSNLDYHHFQHALETVQYAMLLADYAECNGVTLNRRALVAGSLFHDANYHLDHAQAGFSTKEQWSAAIFAGLASAFGFSEDESAMVQEIIQDTTLGREPQSLEGKALVRADLGNVFGDFKKDFYHKTLAYALETKKAKEVSGKIFGLPGFLEKSLVVLCTYLANDLSLGEFDSDWQKPARENLNGMVSKLLEKLKLNMSQESYIKFLSNPKVTEFLGQT